LKKSTAQYDYLATWTNNPENWKAASPIYFIDKIRLLLIYVGEQTYGSIKLQTINFKKHCLSADVSPIYIDKKHVPMVTVFLALE
jgi:hypothetical protein